MPKYNEQTTDINKTITTYEYAYKVDVENQLGKDRSISFSTAQVIVDSATGEEVMGKRLRTLTEVYHGNEEFDLIHPDYGSVVGTMDYDTLFLAVYSLFFHVAQKKDAP